jgi:ABC-type multidrug transport system permease subunit
LPSTDSRFKFLAWSLWFAAITGLTQAIVMLAAGAYTGRIIHVSPHVVWMAPLANLALFGLTALLVSIETRRMAHHTAIAVALSTFIFVAGLGPALIAPRLHPAASLVLLAGIAIQSARFVHARADRARKADALIRRSLPAVLIVTVAAGLFQSGLREF